MFADESFHIDEDQSVAVLASVRHDGLLPENFGGLSDVKFKDFKKARYKNGRYVSSQAWSDQFCRIRIYILDDNELEGPVKNWEDYQRLRVDASEQEAKSFLRKEVDWQRSHLLPEVWVKALTWMSGEYALKLPDWETLYAEVDVVSQFKRQKSKKLVLRSMAINHDMLTYFPFYFTESGIACSTAESIPIQKIATTTAINMAFDIGDKDTTNMIRYLQVQKHHHLKTAMPFHQFRPIDERAIIEVDSSTSTLIQLADVAAGLARDLYETDEREKLVSGFESVFVNGRML